MNKILNFISFFIVFSVMGQSNDPLAKKKLDEMSHYYKQNSNSYFKFQIQSPSMNKNKIQIGLYYQQNDKYLLKIMSTNQLYDGKKLYIINNEEQEVSISKLDNNKEVLSPMSVFSKYQSGYTISFSSKKAILLKPIKEVGIKQILINFDPKSNKIISIIQTELNGDNSLLKILNYKINPKINPSMFVFNKNLYRNYIITEL